MDKEYYVMFPDRVGYEDRIVFDFFNEPLTYDEAMAIRSRWVDRCDAEDLPPVRIVKIVK